MRHALLATLIALILTGSAFAYSSSSFSRPSSSFSRPSSSSSFSRPSSSSPATSTQSFSRPAASTKATTTSRPEQSFSRPSGDPKGGTPYPLSGTNSPTQMSAADRALKNKTSLGAGTSFRSQADAKAAFQQKYSSTYVSTFSREPAVRPTYIPRVYGGYSVIYDPLYHGYGYYDGFHTWHLYNMMEDAMMMNMMMNQTPGYSVAPVAYAQPVAPVAYRTDSDIVTVFLYILLGFTVLVIVVYIIRRLL